MHAESYGLANNLIRPAHSYLSTACLHQEHTVCRLTCKFCVAACSCPCHEETPHPNSGEGSSTGTA